jgi:hypothetical protein
MMGAQGNVPVRRTRALSLPLLHLQGAEVGGGRRGAS